VGTHAQKAVALSFIGFITRATGRHVGFNAPFLTHTALRNQIIQNGARIRETGYAQKAVVLSSTLTVCGSRGPRQI